MKTLFHYYAVSMAIIGAAVVILMWVSAFGLRAFPIGLVMASLLTIAMALFAFGVIQHMRGKIEL